MKSPISPDPCFFDTPHFKIQPPPAVGRLQNVQKVVANAGAFCGLLSDGRTVCWGSPRYGGAGPELVGGSWKGERLWGWKA